MDKAECVVGTKVLFGRKNGEKTLGEIVKVNAKRCKVRQIGTRGTRKKYADGAIWTVPFALLTPFKGEVPESTPAANADNPAAIVRQIKELASRLDPMFLDDLAMELSMMGEAQ